MKIVRHLLIITPSFPEKYEDDIVVPPLHLYLRQLIRVYPDLKISIVSIHYPFHSNKYFLYNMDIYPCGARNGKIWKRPLFWKRALRNMYDIHRQFPVDLVHSFWLNETALITDRFATKNHIPHICTLMGQDVLKSNRYLRFIKMRRINLIALSEFQKNIFLQRYSDMPVNVIPWGIADEETNSLNASEREIDFICVSSLIPLKRVDKFIDLIAIISKNYPHVKATIVGEGPLKGSLENKITELNLEENIVLRGMLPRKECLEEMQKAKVLIHTSSFEAQGYVINEALAAGCEVFTLSQGFVNTCSKLHLCHNINQLVEDVIDYLNQGKFDFSPVFPVAMKATIENYQSVLHRLQLTM